MWVRTRASLVPAGTAGRVVSCAEKKIRGGAPSFWGLAPAVNLVERAIFVGGPPRGCERIVTDVISDTAFWRRTGRPPTPAPPARPPHRVRHPGRDLSSLRPAPLPLCGRPQARAASLAELPGPGRADPGLLRPA